MAYSPLVKAHLSRPPAHWIVVLFFGCQFLFYFLYIRPTTNCSINNGSASIPRYLTYSANSTKNQDDTCYCNGENFCFKGMDESGNVIYGRKFDCRFYSRLKEANLLDSDAKNTKNDFENIANATEWIPVFLTVVSKNHYGEFKPMVESVSKIYPNATIIFYDAGVTNKQAEEVKKLLNIEYRKFNFSAYPAHVPNLKTYAFKIAQIEMFQKYKTFYYFDASVRVRAKLDHLVGVKERKVPPVIMYTRASHSVYATVHPDMLGFFPIPKTLMYVPELEANSMFFSDSSFTRYAFKWWFLCAMTPDCIAPEGAAVKCAIWNYKDLKRSYINCHRFDQAFYNIIILSYLFGEHRAALEYKYVEKNWTTINDALMDEFDRKRMKYVNHYARHIGIDRWEEPDV